MQTGRRVILAATTTGSFLTPFIGSAVTIALPAIADEFSLGAVQLGWVAAAYLLTSAVLLVPLGRLADIHGRKKVFLYGVGLFSLSALLTALSPSVWWLFASRVLNGAGSAMIMSTAIAMLTSVFPPGERGKALGINVAATYVGLSLGPFLGGVLTQHFGWRSIFFLMSVPGVLIAAFVTAKVREEWAEAKNEPFDLAGAAVYGFSLAALMYGFSALPSWRALLCIAAGAGGGALFWAFEMRAASPMLELHLFRSNRVFALSNLAALINYSATFSASMLLSLYLQYIKGLSPQGAGLVIVAQPLVMVLFSPFAGRLSDTVEPRVIASVGMGLACAGLILFSFLGAATPLGMIVATFALLGFGFALFSSPNANAVMSSVEKRSYGIAASTLGTMRLTGQMLSMALLMLTFAVNLGGGAITPASHGAFLASVRTVFIASSFLCFSGVFASLARGRVR